MGVKYAKPINSSRRQLVQVDFSELSKVKPNKVLTHGLSKNGGRDHHGRLTAFRKGGGHKRKYRLIDFKSESENQHIRVTRGKWRPSAAAQVWLSLLSL